MLSPLDLTVDVPNCFLQIFYAALQVGAPDVLHGVTQTKVHVLGDLDALHAAFMAYIMSWVIHWVVHALVASFKISMRSRAARKVQ
jgi:hypothetical protein